MVLASFWDDHALSIVQLIFGTRNGEQKCFVRLVFLVIFITPSVTVPDRMESVMSRPQLAYTTVTLMEVSCNSMRSEPFAAVV